MSTIGIKDLQEQAETIVTRVEETGETIEIVVHGALRLASYRPVRSTRLNRSPTSNELRPSWRWPA